MVPSSNKIADGLLASANDGAVHDGLRLAVPAYLEAVDALVAEDRRGEARNVLAELLAAKEKRRGFFLGRREQSALGDQRARVAGTYARLIRGDAPSEGSLDTLSQLAIEFPGDYDIRIANAEGLSQAGYLLDAVDEFRTCKSMRPDDVELDVALANLFSRLGRFDDAAETLAALNVDQLRAHRGTLDEVAAAFGRSESKDPGAHAATITRFAAGYEKLLSRDKHSDALWSALTALDAAAAAAVRGRLDGKPPVHQATPVPAAETRPTPSAASAEQVATPPATPPSAPVTATPAAASAAPPAQPAPTPTPAKRPATGGLAAFAKRKALELFADSEYDAARAELERVVKMSPDVESMEMLLECYLVLDRHADAGRIGVALADAELEAGNRPGAIATLTTLSKKITDPAVEQRRVELTQST